MHSNRRPIIISLTASVLAIGVIAWCLLNPVRLGDQPLLVRALIIDAALLAALVAFRPWIPRVREWSGARVVLLCTGAMLPALVWFLLWLPARSGTGLEASQLYGGVPEDSAGRGLVEMGFPWPVYTPTFRFRNQDLFSRRINVFMRMTDEGGDSFLVRAVRSQPAAGLNVEATLYGMLSETPGFLFNPVALPPRRTTTAQMVFVISNLDDGAAFNEALSRGWQAWFELRDPQSGDLLLEFPLVR